MVGLRCEGWEGSGGRDSREWYTFVRFIRSEEEGVFGAFLGSGGVNVVVVVVVVYDM